MEEEENGAQRRRKEGADRLAEIIKNKDEPKQMIRKRKQVKKKDSRK